MKKNWLKSFVAILLILLFAVLAIIVVSFDQNREQIDVEFNDRFEDTIEFQNDSSMSEQEIRELVEQKRTELQDFFDVAQYYKPSEVSIDHTPEDDTYDIVVTESFFKTLQDLLSEELYQSYFSQFTVVNPRENINITETLYVGSKEIFQDINIESAIAMTDVSEENLILSSATDDTIIAYENIRYCNEDGTCVRDEYYHLNLQKENDVWKIAEFTKQR